MEQSETDKNGDIVEGSFDFGFIDPPEAEEGKEITVNLKASSRFVLLEAKLTSAHEEYRGDLYYLGPERGKLSPPFNALDNYWLKILKTRFLPARRAIPPQILLHFVFEDT